MGVANRPRPELHKHRRKTPAPHETNALFKMTIKCTGKRNHRERDKIPPVDRQASQPAQYRGPETRDQIMDISGGRCGLSQRWLGKTEPPGLLALFFHLPSLFSIWRIPMRHYLRIGKRYTPYHGTRSTVPDKKIGNIRPDTGTYLYSRIFSYLRAQGFFDAAQGFPEAEQGFFGAQGFFPDAGPSGAAGLETAQGFLVCAKRGRPHWGNVIKTITNATPR